MRIREYLSPTSISVFYDDPELFYLQYLTDYRLEREPQTPAMSVGSSFDAYCKHNLHKDLFGGIEDQAFDFDNLFTAMVEPHNRDQAKLDGQHIFETYRRNGGYNNLLYELANNSLHKPKMEFEIRGVVAGARKGEVTEANGVVLLGKPDLHWVTKQGYNVVFDWKVNGYYSRSAVSPHPGYLKLRQELKCLTDYANTQHKLTRIGELHGQKISITHPLEVVNEKWAAQLAVYGWLLKIPVGEEFLTFIDQVVCKPTGTLPQLRFAEHRTKISQGFQFDTLNKAQHVWDICKSGWVFRHLTEQESKAKQDVLDKRVANVGNMDELMSMISKKRSW